MNLQGLLEPRSIAIAGASGDPGKLSGMILDFLAKSGFDGRVFPINPRYDNIGGMPCYPSVEALPESVDLLVCVVPVAAAFASIEAAARRGVRFCLLMTGGFGEGRSGEEGRARLDRLQRLCTETGMHVVGPNTVGMVNFRRHLPLTFADWYGRDTGLRGGVAIVTHSGSVGGLIFSSLQLNRIGVDYWIGLGNEATLETADFIDHFSADPEVHTIICYMEGVRNGRKFIAAAEAARRAGKRIVVLKAGEYPDSLRSTIAHTAKHPTDRDVYAGIFRQLGVIQVASLAELSYVMTLLTSVGDRLGPRVGIISASGGACSVIADHVIQAGLQLPELPPSLQQTLDRGIPLYGSSSNPVDLSADVVARGEILAHTLAALREDDSINVWMVFGRPIIDRYHAMLTEFVNATGKAVVVCCGVPLAPDVHAALAGHGIAVLLDPELCMRALARIACRPPEELDPVPPPPLAGRAGAGSIVRGGQAGELLARHGLSASSAAVPWLRVEIGQDRDFGPVVMANWLPAYRVGAHRVVRALPASHADLLALVDDLGQQLQEWPAEPVDIEDALSTAVRVFEQHTELHGLGVELGSANGQVVVCTASSRQTGAG
ncbi:MAG: CoA-binding protein [Pigmentiphaga sp.]|uniref:CoA-binding protein n=1 Tax=Pigmentiphaga sp. TaxID=1977564 RepID=UPI0029B6140B|nr:CoA-binding protein [Pigmentiphaga sp.]MDX3906599.1 CoA-binding protein [Pigmentiphaga sp.]